MGRFPSTTLSTRSGWAAETSMTTKWVSLLRRTEQAYVRKLFRKIDVRARVEQVASALEQAVGQTAEPLHRAGCPGSRRCHSVGSATRRREEKHHARDGSRIPGVELICRAALSAAHVPGGGASAGAPQRSGLAVSENTESLIALRRMLSALEAAEPRIQLQVERGRVGKRSGVELKLEDFAAGTSLGMQDSQSKWLLATHPSRRRQRWPAMCQRPSLKGVREDQSIPPARWSWQSRSSLSSPVRLQWTGAIACAAAPLPWLPAPWATVRRRPPGADRFGRGAGLAAGSRASCNSRPSGSAFANRSDPFRRRAPA